MTTHSSPARTAMLDQAFAKANDLVDGLIEVADDFVTKHGPEEGAAQLAVALTERKTTTLACVAATALVRMAQTAGGDSRG